VPLLGWLLSFWSDRRLALALDVTNPGSRADSRIGFLPPSQRRVPTTSRTDLAPTSARAPGN